MTSKCLPHSTRPFARALAFLLTLPLCGIAGTAVAANDSVDARALLRKIDDMWRGASSAAIMSMRIKTENWERTLEMKTYSKGTDLTLVRIVAPKQEAGTATLKVDENIWNYLPKTRRVMKVPPSMMMGSWMGSHFTNDDLVRESRLEEDYFFELTESTTEAGRPAYLLTLTPRPQSAVVWGKIVLEVDEALLMPTWEEYYGDEGELVRRAVFEDFERVGERLVPMTMRMVPMDRPGELTEIKYEKLMFDVPLEDEFFSIQNLKRR